MLRAGHGIIIVAISLLTIGVVMVNSAALTVGSDNPVSLSGILTSRYAMLAAAAIVCLLIGSCVPVQRLFASRGLNAPVLWLMLGSVALLIAVHIPGIGKPVNGAWRWIEIGPLQFQPSEIAKWSILIALAWHAVRKAGAMHRLWAGFVPPMMLVGLICALIALEDLGTAVLVGLVAVCVLIAAGARVWHALLLVPVGVAGFAAAVIHAPYRVDRLRAFLDPYADPQGVGYHMIQSMAAVSGGGLSGRGLGNGIQKFGYLPEDTTDFIFAVICEEIGIVGAVLVIALYLALIGFGLSIVQRTPHAFSRILGLGVVLTVTFQALINMAVVTGIAPTKGIALPLISAGGTGWWMTAFSLGLLVSIDRATLRHEQQTAHEQREILHHQIAPLVHRV